MKKLGMIDYLNLLPFHIFMKQNIKSTQLKAIINYNKSIPTNINKQFKKRQINEAFISSVELLNHYQFYPVGIIATKEVQSVIVVQNGKYTYDKDSASSNQLAKILGITGQVLIGDKALKYSTTNNNYIDLAQAWFDKYQLPFVFAVFAINRKTKQNKKLINKFRKYKNIKIPMYILNQYKKQLKISINDIKQYLNLITYQINHKEMKSLKLFLKLSQK